MKISLAKSKKGKSIDDFYIQQYSNWRKNLSSKEFEAKFFILYKDFEVHLKNISPGALKLYLFYGFNAKNETGLLWYGVESISKYFDVSEKTINNWNKELIERGLIARESRNNRRNKTTYLLPFSLNLINLKDLDLIDTVEFKTVYGSQYKAFHLFQWRKESPVEDAAFDKPYHSMILIFQNKFTDDRFDQYTAFHCPIPKEYNKVIDGENITTDIYVFNSDFEHPNIKVPINGVAVNTRINIRLNHVLYNLIKELIDEETDLSWYKEVNLIEKEGCAIEQM